MLTTSLQLGRYFSVDFDGVFGTYECYTLIAIQRTWQLGLEPVAPKQHLPLNTSALKQSEQYTYERSS